MDFYNNHSQKKCIYNKLKCILIILSIIIVLNLVTRLYPSFGNWYSMYIYPFFVTVFGRIFSIIPYSVSELLIIAFIIFLIGCFLKIISVIIISIYHYFFSVSVDITTLSVKEIKKEKFISFDKCKRIFITLIEVISILCLIFTFTCGINYYRNTFATYSGLSIEAYSKTDLVQLCKHLIKVTNELSTKIETDSNNLCVVPLNSHTTSMATMAMTNLGETYPVLSGYYPRVKQIIFSDIMSYQQIGGIYSPFTVEANINKNMPNWNIPSTMCHELSHLKGFMREDEAEFISYLACRNSPELAFQYSGNLTALIYSLRALQQSGAITEYNQLYATLSEQIKKELHNEQLYWSNFEGTISEIANKTNDTYLKINGQTDGVQSYGRMVDLLLADFKNS